MHRNTNRNKGNNKNRQGIIHQIFASHRASFKYTQTHKKALIRHKEMTKRICMDIKKGTKMDSPTAFKSFSLIFNSAELHIYRLHAFAVHVHGHFILLLFSCAESYCFKKKYIEQLARMNKKNNFTAIEEKAKVFVSLCVCEVALKIHDLRTWNFHGLIQEYIHTQHAHEEI